MSTITLTAEINKADVSLFETLLKRVKAKKVVFKENDDTKMSKADFFTMIDQARKQPSQRVSIEELKSRYL